MTAPVNLGILGGMGPRSTILFEELLLQHIPHARDQDVPPWLTLFATFVPDRTESIVDGNAATRDALTSIVGWLDSLGIPNLAIPCNTAHTFLDAIRQAFSGSVMDMVDLAARRIKELQLGRVEVWSTRGTRMAGLYDKAAREHGWLVEPTDEQRQLTLDVVIDAVKRGDEAGAAVRLRPLLTRDEPPLLACTELSVVAHKHLRDQLWVDALEQLAIESARTILGAAAERRGTA